MNMLTNICCSFFEDSATTLNLDSLCTLLGMLCAADEDSLRKAHVPETGTKASTSTDIFAPSCALPRIARLVCASVKGRPLVHLMRIWGAVRTHFVEVSNKHVTNVHPVCHYRCAPPSTPQKSIA